MQHVLITGASAGVGRATAIEYAKRGANVTLVARGRAGLDGAAKDVEAAGGSPLTIQCDVSDEEALEAAADQAETTFGPIDVWINNAMVTVMSQIWDTTVDDYRRVMEVNFLGAVNGTHAALRRMRPRDAGTIVQVGSALAYRGIPLQSAYCASKHALQGFMDSLRAELLEDDSNVHVCTVHLPGLNTPQFTWSKTRLPKEPQPVPPIFQPEVAAEGIVWTVDQQRKETWVAGSAVGTIVGNRIAPRLLDRYLAANAFAGQQTDQPVDHSRHDNLYEPKDEHEDRGVHGPFDDRAKDSSTQQELIRNAGKLAAGGAALVAGALAAVGLARRSS